MNWGTIPRYNCDLIKKHFLHQEQGVLTAFVLWDFKIIMKQWLLYASFFLPLSMGVSILSLCPHCMLGVRVAYNLSSSSQFSGSRNWNCTQGTSATSEPDIESLRVWIWACHNLGWDVCKVLQWGVNVFAWCGTINYNQKTQKIA